MNQTAIQSNRRNDQQELPRQVLNSETLGIFRRNHASPITRQRRNNAPFDPLIALSQHGTPRRGRQRQQRAVGRPVARLSVTLIYVRDLAANQRPRIRNFDNADVIPNVIFQSTDEPQAIDAIIRASLPQLGDDNWLLLGYANETEGQRQGVFLRIVDNNGPYTFNDLRRYVNISHVLFILKYIVSVASLNL